MMRLGVFGGTFNPIHLGHLILAETAREELTLDRVIFIPSGQPPHKRTAGLLPGPVRMQLVELAIQGHPDFVVSDIELQRAGTSYSIDTVQALRRRVSDAELFLLMGEDMLAVKWAAWKELKALATIVVARRPAVACGSRHFPRRPRLSAGCPPRSGARRRRERGITWLAMPQMEISSSDIRARLKQGRSIRYLVPPAVERHIRQHRLYTSH